MAHAAKFTGASAHHIIGHCIREQSSPEILKYQTTSAIDSSRSHLNGLANLHGKPHEYFNRRKKEIGVKRKDQVTLVDWVVTLPQELEDLSYEQQTSFFLSCANFVLERYGEENVIGAYMHFDETTPHVHIPFMPIKDGKFQCKNILNRKDLNTFHEDLIEYLQNDKTLDFEVKAEYILNGKTTVNKSIAELKAQSEVAYHEAHAEQLSDQVSKLKKEKNKLEQSIADRQVVTDALIEIDSLTLPEPKKTPIGYLFSQEQYNSINEQFDTLKTQINAVYEHFETKVGELSSALEEQETKNEKSINRRLKLKKENERLEYLVSDKVSVDMHEDFVQEIRLGEWQIKLPKGTNCNGRDIGLSSFFVEDYQISKSDLIKHKTISLPKNSEIMIRDKYTYELMKFSSVELIDSVKDAITRFKEQMRERQYQNSYEQNRVAPRRQRSRDDEWEL